MLEERIAEVRNRSEDYRSSVSALLGFSAFVVHDGTDIRDEGVFGFGRRMDTSEENKVAPDSEITPDVVAQKNSEYGVVGELKRSLLSDQNKWKQHVDRLRKYDDQLTGWWTPTETIGTSDAVLLIHQSRSRAFLRILNELIHDDPELLSENTAIIEFNRSQEADAFVFFRREWGEIGDEELAERLELGVQVPIEKVMRSFGQVQFYDAPPPIPWLMALLWTDVFLPAYDPENYDEAKEATPISVNCEEITKELQQAYGSGVLRRDARSKEFPRKIWVKRALESLVSARLAVSGDRPDDYTILYRLIRGDVLERFVKLTEGPSDGEARGQDEQTSLDLTDEKYE